MMCEMMTGMMGGMGTMGMMGMMMLGPILLAALIGVVVYLVVRTLMKKNKIDDHPLMILKERFAKGEITEAEFNEKRNVLNKG